MRLRLATLNDAPAIATMYNQGIEERASTASTPSSSSKRPSTGHRFRVHQPLPSSPVLCGQGPRSRSMSNAPGADVVPVAWHWRGSYRKRRKLAFGSWCHGCLSKTRRAARCSAHRAFARWAYTKSTPSWTAYGVMSSLSSGFCPSKSAWDKTVAHPTCVSFVRII